MKILVAAHKHPVLNNPRGGEHSMRIISEYLAQEHEVTVLVRHGDYSSITQNGVEYVSGLWDQVWRYVADTDYVLSWGNAALESFRVVEHYQKPMLLFVRWWRNVCPLPPGDLMTREINPDFVGKNQKMFDYCDVVTNNAYSVEVIKRIYGVDATVSFVPIEGEGYDSKRGEYLTFVTPHKALGEAEVIKDLLAQGQKVLVVNPGKELEQLHHANLKTIPYVSDMKEVWDMTEILMSPIYHNDVCGTTRIVIEAMQNGTPVIANDRSGLGEKVPNLVSRNAFVGEWLEAIEAVRENYDKAVMDAHEIWEAYDTPAQLEIIANIINERS